MEPDNIKLDTVAKGVGNDDAVDGADDAHFTVEQEALFAHHGR